MQKQLNIDINKMEAEHCDCGCPFFRSRSIIKRIPALLAGDTKDQFVNLSFWACEKCGKPHHNTGFIVPPLNQPVAPPEPSEEPPSNE